jgi:hypothetical protein
MALQSFAEAYKNDNQPFAVSINDKDYEGFFADIRVDKKTLPEGWYAYDLREEEGEICELKNGYIWANHYGTFCTQNMLPLEDKTSLYIDSDYQDFDYSFM